MEVLELLLDHRADDVGEQAAGVGVEEGDEAIGDQVHQGVEQREAVHVDAHVLELVNLELLQLEGAVGADGQRQLHIDVANVALDLEVRVDDLREVCLHIGVELDILVAQTQTSLERAVLVANGGIAVTGNVAQAVDHSVLEVDVAWVRDSRLEDTIEKRTIIIMVTFDVNGAEVSVHVEGVVGNVEGIDVLLLGEGGDHLVDKLVGVAIGHGTGGGQTENSEHVQDLHGVGVSMSRWRARERGSTRQD